MRKTKHAAMDQRPDIRLNCPIGKLVDGRIITPENRGTITQTRDTITRTDNRDTITSDKTRDTITLKLSDAIYRAGNYVVFKSEIPHTVDVFEIRPDKKLRPVGSFMRDADRYALGAAKKFLLTKV